MTAICFYQREKTVVLYENLKKSDKSLSLNFIYSNEQTTRKPDNHNLHSCGTASKNLYLKENYTITQHCTYNLRQPWK